MHTVQESSPTITSSCPGTTAMRYPVIKFVIRPCIRWLVNPPQCNQQTNSYRDPSRDQPKCSLQWTKVLHLLIEQWDKVPLGVKPPPPEDNK